MKKRMTAAFTAAAMMVSALPYTAVDNIVNAVSTDLVIRSVSNYTSEGIAVDIDILKNTGYISGSVDVNWDKTALTLVRVDFNTEAAQDNNSVPVPENGDTDGNYRLSLGDFLAEENNTSTGRAATLYFEKNSQDDDGTGYNIDLNNSDFVNSSVSQLVVDEIDCTAYALDASKMYISGDTVKGYTGASNIRVPVNMINSPGYISGTFDIAWDKDNLTLTGIEYNDDIAPALNAVPIPETGVTTGRYKVSFGDLLAEENYSSAGNMMTLVFKASGDAEGTYPINFSNADIVNYDVQQVECKFSPAQVSLEKGGAIFDENTKTVTLCGKITDYWDIRQYSINNSAWGDKPIRKMIAAEGTTFPDDCSHMFDGVVAEEVDLSGADFSNVTNMKYMFNNSRIKKINLANSTTSNVTDMSWMFYDCWNLTDIDMTGLDTSNVENMQCMFYEMNAIEEIDVSSFDTSKVTNMERMFSYDPKLKSIDVSSFNTENVTNMYWMFYSNNSLESIKLGDFNTSNVTDMYGIFAYNSNLSDIDVSGFDMSNVTKGGSMFSGDTALAHKLCQVYSSERIPKNDGTADFKIYLSVGSDADELIIRDTDGTMIGDYFPDEIDELKDENGRVVIKYNAPLTSRDEIKIHAMDPDGRLLIHTNADGMLQTNGVTPYSFAPSVLTVGDVYMPGDTFYLYNKYIYSSRDNKNIKFSGTYTVSSVGLDGNAHSDCASILFTKNNENLSLYETANGRPIGFKIVSGTGSYSDPYRFECIFDMELSESSLKEATCTEDGSKQYYYGKYGEQYLYADKSFTRLTDQNGDNKVDANDVKIPAFGHDYDEPVYEWSEDNASCTKSRTCKHDPSHIVSETAEAVTKPGNHGGEYAEAVFRINETKYAHTANISDDGVQNGSYSNGLNDIQTITIPGAEKLNVTLKYGTESGYDYLNIYTGNPFSDNDDYDEYTEIIDTVSPVAQYDGNNNSPETVKFEIEGDTVTFNFTSDGSQTYYGYYAIVEGSGDGDIQTKWTKRVDISDGTFAANPITYAYDGEEHTVSGVVKYEGEKLTDGEDYTLSGNTATEKGVYTAKVEGINKFDGELNAVWRICDAYNVKVIIGDTETNTSYEEKSLVRCESVGEGGWFVNDVLTSTKNRLSFTVLGDTVVEWREGEFSKEGIVNCVLSDRKPNGEYTTVLATSTWAVPDEAVILAAGTARCYVSIDEDAPEKNILFESGKKYMSSLTKTNGTFQYNVNMGAENGSKKLCMVAYVTYQIGDEQITVISDVATSMNE